MTVNEHVLLLVAMAAAIVAILTIGTLIAADIIPLGNRQDRARPSEGRQSAGSEGGRTA